MLMRPPAPPPCHVCVCVRVSVGMTRFFYSMEVVSGPIRRQVGGGGGWVCVGGGLKFIVVSVLAAPAMTATAAAALLLVAGSVTKLCTL